MRLKLIFWEELGKPIRNALDIQELILNLSLFYFFLVNLVSFYRDTIINSNIVSFIFDEFPHYLDEIRSLQQLSG